MSPPVAPRSICLLRLSALGDATHVVPLIRTLRRAWPDVPISWILGKGEAKLMEGLKDVELIVFDKGAGARGVWALRQALAGRPEILESGDAHATHSLLRNGSGRLQTFAYSLLPQNAAELTSYTVYRWECAIRSSAVLGFVGAGGLGQLMDSSMKMFNGAEVATILIVFMALVWLADYASAWLRRQLG